MDPLKPNPSGRALLDGDSTAPEARLRALMKATSQFLWELDAEGHLKDVQPWSEYTGLPEASLRGEGWQEAIHPEDRERIGEDWKRAFETRAEIQAEFRLRAADGSYRWFECHGIPNEDEAGRPAGWMGLCRDIQSEKRALEKLQKSEADLEDAQAIAHMGNWTWDLLTDEASWSAEMFRIFGRDPHQHVTNVSQTLQDIHPDDRPMVDTALKAALEDRAPYDVDYRIALPDGSLRAIHVRARVTHDASGKPVRMAGTVLDITERKRIEAELRSQNSRIEAEVARRTAELAASEARLAEAQKVARMGSWEWEVGSDSVVWSDQQYRLFGFEPRACEPTYETVIERVHPDDRERHTAIVRKALSDHQPYAFDHRVVHPDGTVLTLYSLGRAVVDEKGQLQRLMGTSQDVTAQRRLEQERARAMADLKRQQELTQRIIDHTPAGIAYLDRDLIYRSVNLAQSRMFQIPVQNLVGCKIFDALGPQTEEQIGPLLRGVLDSGKPYYGTSFPFAISRDGSERMTYWDFTYQPVFAGSGEVEGVLILALEVSERVERERLQQDRIKSLEQADRMKDEFLSVISHELRTPLNFIMGFASILEDEVAGELNRKQHDFLEKIVGGAERMLGLVNNLLDLSQMAAGKFRFVKDATPYAPLIVEAVSPLQPLADEKAIRLEITGTTPRELVLDGPRIVQVLTNLIHNAIKFTPRGGEIRVSAREADGGVLTEVTDTGAGLAPEDISKLFKRFSQTDMSTTRPVGGSGLGLAISKSIIDAHGGRIGVSSEPGQGSTFWFWLPG